MMNPYCVDGHGLTSRYQPQLVAGVGRYFLSHAFSGHFFIFYYNSDTLFFIPFELCHELHMFVNSKYALQNEKCLSFSLEDNLPYKTGNT